MGDDMPTPREAELIREALSGSTDAIGELFSSHWTGAWRAAMGITGSRALADDIAQDAFERAIFVENCFHNVTSRAGIHTHGDNVADPAPHNPGRVPLHRDKAGRLRDASRCSTGRTPD